MTLTTPLAAAPAATLPPSSANAKSFRAHLQLSLACLLAFLLAFLGWQPEAYAIDEATQLTAYELEQEVERSQAAYAEARAEVEKANEAVAENEERIAAIEAQIPEQQRRSAAATRELYKFQQESAGIVDFLLSAGDFYEFLSGLEYVNRVTDANMSEINRLSAMKAELDDQHEQLQRAHSTASARASEASDAMDVALEAQAEVQRRIEEEARHEAELAAAAAALAEQQRANDVGAIENAPEAPEGSAGANAASAPEGASAEAASAEAAPADGDPAGEAAEGNASEGAASEAEEAAQPAEQLTEVEASSDEATFLAEWTPRIDAYLAGSPLAGQGATFAKAAYTYGVDPRFSPAISYTESSKGAVCFKSHNAWGWGSSSWDTWEAAIDAHVGGLSRGYGYTISEEGAKKYCPPNWEHWYNTTLAQMNLI